MDETRAKLLEAAGEDFAEKGFERATVRSICDRAQVKNMAAINYYFGSKEKLYECALFEAHRCGVELFAIPEVDGLAPGEQLRSYVRIFLAQVLATTRDAGWHHRLMLREIVEPSFAIDVLVQKAIGPRFRFLLGILARICPDAEERTLHALAFSVIGQCLHYKFAAQINLRLIGEPAFARLDLDFLSEHIASFTLAALGVIPALDRSGESTGSPARSSNGRETD